MQLPPLPFIDGLEPDPERRPPPPEELRLRRIVADHLGLWARCPLAGCRTGGRCRQRTVACFDTERQLVADAMNAFIYAGYLADAEDELY